MSAGKWWKIAGINSVAERGRLHTCIEGRYITIFRNKGKLSAIDSVCHHAGGPLTDGPLRDIEDLGLTAVSCPWHNFLVCVDKGIKVFQSIELINGSPRPAGWKVGKVVQRVHTVREDTNGIFVVS